jgi:hypothetical protein
MAMRGAAMMATIWGGLVNAVLDPILIFGLNLELTGAALASVAARLTIAGWRSPILRHYGGLVRPSRPASRRISGPSSPWPCPAILTQLATPGRQAFVTRSMAEPSARRRSRAWPSSRG